MIIHAQRDHLINLFGKAQNIVDKSNTMPVLSNVLLIASEDQKLTLYATDLEVSIKSKCTATVEKPGQLVVNARNLFQLLKEMQGNEVHLSSTPNGALHVEQGQAYFTINGMDPSEFPEMSIPENISYVSLPAKALNEMIEKTVYSTSMDETRYHLNGVFFEEEGEESFRMVATDGHRLSLIDRNFETHNHLAPLLKEGVIVPRKGLYEIKKLIDATTDNKNVEISVDGAQFVFKTADTLLMVRLIEGKYPDYRRLLPTDLNIHTIVNKNQFLASLKRVSLLSNQKSRGITMSLSKGHMEIFSISPELGQGKEQIPVEYDEQDLKIGINSKYLLEVLSTIEEEQVRLSFKDENSPVLVVPGSGTGYKCVVMPMRI